MESQKIKIITLRNEDTGAEDQYALNLRPLGQGKSAKVFKATSWPDQKKLFAVKVIKITDEEVKKDYLKELKIIKNLPDCPNIVKTHKQHLESQNNLYIFQQYCQLGTLANFKNEKLGIPFTEEQIYDLFLQTSNGLIFLLETGIIHQDIKPANILKKNIYYKLCDFGVSQISKEYIESTTRRGTISYMPPQKLKYKNFTPSDKSDIYSLGVCLYEIIFGIHPYLSKKTTNYKEYLLALNGATLKPLAYLMKKIGSTSFKLENLFKFIERMIDLNAKTRASLQDLKQFIATNEPFKNMRIKSEDDLQFNNFQNRISISQTRAHALFTSVVKYRQDNSNNNLPIINPPVNPHVQNKNKITLKFNQDNPFVNGVIRLLINSIEHFRKVNFNSWNIKPVEKNFLGIDLSTCKISRFIKYLIYQFSLTILKVFKKKYQQFLDENQCDQLCQNEEFLSKQFNKFLIQCDFENKQELAEEIKERNNIDLWMFIVKFYEQCIENLTIIQENKRNVLLGYLYCIYIPKILEKFKNLPSIFSQWSLQQLQKKADLDDTSLQDGQKLLEEINNYQRMKKQMLQEIVQQKLSKLSKEFIFDIGEDSDEIQVITEEELQKL